MYGQIQSAGPPPFGVHSNFVDPVNYAPNLVICNVILLVFSTLLVAARVVSRNVLTDWKLGWDDYMIILSLIGTAIFTSFVITTTNYGLGKHIWDVPLSDYSPGYLWWIMATFAACPASYYFVKISILFFYLRVFQLQANLRYIIYALFAYCTLYYGIAFFAIIGLCNSKNKTWDITVSMNCFADGPLVLAIGGLDLIADALLLAFPIPMVMRLRISWPQRIYLLFVFLAGILASVACAIRIAFAAQAGHTDDATMAQYHVVTLFCIEHYLALIAACMPTLGPFFRYLRPSHLKNVAQGQQHLGNDPYDEIERQWPRPHKTSPDSSLLRPSINEASESTQHFALPSWARPHFSRKNTGKSVRPSWNNGKDDFKHEVELQETKATSMSETA